MLTIQELIFLTDTQRNPGWAEKHNSSMWLLSGKTHFLDVGGFCIPSKAIIFISFQSRVRSKGCKKKPTHVNPAVFDGRAILSKAKDEQPHIVFLPSSEAEPKAPRAPLQLYWVTPKAL